MAQGNLQQGGFALGAGEVQRQQNVSTQLGQSGISGGRSHASEPNQRVVIDTSTTDLLMKLGNKILEPQIQKIQTQKFLEGAQRVAQGEALKDIVDEQPWFTQIFGPSSSTQGARAVAQMRGVDDYITSVANDMPQLQQLSTEEFGKKITGKMQDFLTGDSVADAAIQMKMVESTGALFKAHTKANYKFTQDTMQQNTVQYMQSGANKLAALSKQRLDGTMTDTDYNGAVNEFITNLAPIEGQSPGSYWKGIEIATEDALAMGNHHAANAVFDSGLLASAPGDLRKKLLDARHTYEARTQETAGFVDFGPRIGQLKGLAAAGQLSGKQIQSAVDDINNEYSIKYGINRPLFKRNELESIISGNISSIYNRREQDIRDQAKEGRQDLREAAKEKVKTDADLRKSQQLVSLIQAGAGNMAGLAGYTGDEINNAVFTGAQTLAANGKPVGPYLVQQYNEGGEHVNPLYKNKLQAGMRAAKEEGYSGAAFEQSYAMYKQISGVPGGTATAMAYLGDDAVRMMKYDQFVQNKMTPEISYQLAFGATIDGTRKSSDKDLQKQIVQTVDKAQPGTFSKLFGSIEMTEQSKRVLTSAVGQNFDKLVTNAAMDSDTAMQVSLNVAKGELDVVGPYVIPKGTDRKPVYQMIGADEKTAGIMFSEFLTDRARQNGVLVGLPGQGKSDGGVAFAADLLTAGALPAISRWTDRAFGAEPDVVITRLPDQKGVGMFGVTIVTPKGEMKSFPITTDEVRTYYEKHKNFK